MKSPIFVTALVLLLVGGLNWGLVGLFEYNLVDAVLGEASTLSRVVYSVVGLSAAYVAVVYFTDKDK